MLGGAGNIFLSVKLINFHFSGERRAIYQEERLHNSILPIKRFGWKGDGERIKYLCWKVSPSGHLMRHCHLKTTNRQNKLYSDFTKKGIGTFSTNSKAVRSWNPNLHPTSPSSLVKVRLVGFQYYGKGWNVNGNPMLKVLFQLHKCRKMHRNHFCLKSTFHLHWE